MNDQFDSHSEPSEDLELSMPELTAEEKDRLLDAIKPAPSVISAPGQDEAEPDFSRTMTGTTEDWGMTAPLAKPPAPPEQTGWQLPVPVFRSSEGYTPKKFVGQTKINDGNSPVAASAAVPDFAELPAPPIPFETSAPELKQSPAPVVTAAAVIAPPVAKVEPQPDIIEEFPAPPVAAPVTIKPKSGAWRIVSIVFGLLAMLAFAAGFLALIYFLFFYKAVAE